MGDLRSRIFDDEEEYEALCKKYGEQVQYDEYGPKCYGEHADSLRERARKDLNK